MGGGRKPEEEEVEQEEGAALGGGALGRRAQEGRRRVGVTGASLRIWPAGKGPLADVASQARAGVF